VVDRDGAAGSRRNARGSDQRQAWNYRPDIDGLRALAVLGIVAFHFGFRFVGGGYVGVDIFFVISGFLIGGQVQRQQEEGTFRLSAFYERRLRRIAPALAFMLLGVTLVGMVVLLPLPLVEHGKSLIAATLSLSNFYFWQSSDYFAPAAESLPLLHTWSLGVEEQFYILLPLVLVLPRQFRIGGNTVIIVIALLSFALSVALTFSHPTFNFYLLPTRAWQLLLGTIVASIGPAIAWRQSLRETAATLGLALIVMPFFLYTPAEHFPGLAALPPSLGTAFILASGINGGAMVNRSLSSRKIVFFGLISYSLYLWHWPVVVMIKQAMPEGWLRMPERIGGLLLSIMLGWASWHFVERPFRSRRTSVKQIFAFSAGSAIVTLLLGSAIIIGKGLPWRFPADVQRVAAYLDRSPSVSSHGCFIGLYGRIQDYDRSHCLQPAADRPNVLLIGDSHASHLRFGLSQMLPQVHVMQAAAAGCRTLLKPQANQTPTCGQFRKLLFGDILSGKPPATTIILSNFWSYAGLADVGETLDWMQAHGLHVIVAGPIPRYEMPLPQVLARSMLTGSEFPLDRARVAGIADFDARFASVARAHRVAYWSLYKSLCPAGHCQTVSAGVPIQFDSAHLSDQGSLLAARGFPKTALN